MIGGVLESSFAQKQSHTPSYFFHTHFYIARFDLGFWEGSLHFLGGGGGGGGRGVIVQTYYRLMEVTKEQKKQT